MSRMNRGFVRLVAGLPLVLTYALVATYFARDRANRKGAAARSLQTERTDRGSTRRLVAAYEASGLALLAAPLLNHWKIGRLRGPANWLGVFLSVTGLELRSWANHTLGEYYTRTLRVTEKQRLVQEGPYRLVRHPGYLGSLLLWSGAALGSSNGLVAVLLPALMFCAYGYRIQSEESMMADALGDEYEEYRSRTWRLIPFIF